MNITITQTTSLLSLTLAIIALSFSIWQYFDRKATENSLRKSRIIMRLGALWDIDLIFQEVKIIDEVIFRQRYRCVLSNIGYVNEGIVFCDVYNLVQQEVEGKKKLSYSVYAGMNPSLINEDDENISFPFNIAARESKTIYIDIGMIVPRQAWIAVSEKIELGKPIAWKEAEQIFSAAGYPYFGQLTEIGTDNMNSYFLKKFGPAIFYQSFSIRFLKTDNSQVTGEFSLQGNDLNIQGEA